MKKEIKVYVLSVLFTEAVGLVSGLLSRGAARIYAETVAKPPLSPPAILFPIVWSVLYGLMGVALARAVLSPPSRDRTLGIRFFAGQLAFNFFWPLIFFNAGAFGAAFFWLLAMLGLIAATAVFFFRADRPAAYLLIPYIVWVVFAGYLNLGVWILN